MRVLFLLTGFVCMLASGATGTASMPDERPVPFATVDQGTHSGVREPFLAIVRTPEEWARLWSRHAGPSAALPSIEFSMEMVVAVFAGQRPTGGYALEITRVLATDQGLRVTYQERTPPPGALVIQVLTAPFHVIRLPNSADPVHVVREGE